MKRFVLIFIAIALIVVGGVCAFILNNCPDSSAAQVIREQRDRMSSYVSEKCRSVCDGVKSLFAKKPSVSSSAR